jgi:hypothetical protein
MEKKAQLQQFGNIPKEARDTKICCDTSDETP